MLALRRRTRGTILLISLILVVVILGMSGSYMVVSSVQAHRVSEQLEQNRARDASEAGIDHMRVFLLGLVNPTSQDPGAAWDNVLATNGGTPAWAGSVETPDGSYTVRVLDNDDGDGNLLDDLDGTVILEATGYGSKLGAAGASHVIRCMVTLEVNDPTDNYAIITGNDLIIYGNEVVDGSLGSVHTNANLDLQGSALVSQNATASGTTTVTGTNVTVGHDLLSNQALVPIQTVDPTLYRPYANYILTSGGRVLDGATGAVLFDFSTHGSLKRTDTRRMASLPDGRLLMYSGFGMPNDRNNNNGYGNTGGGHSSTSNGANSSTTTTSTTSSGTTSSGTTSSSTTSSGTTSSSTTSSGTSGSTTSGTTTTTSTTTAPGTSAGSTSSSGSTTTTTTTSSGSTTTSSTTTQTGGGNTVSYNGFTWSSSRGWSTATSGWVNGMYYIEGNINFNHGGTSTVPWKVTLVATGDISMQGNPYMQPYLNKVELFVAGGDVYARGTGTNALLEGLILAHEQVNLDGNITFAGRIVAESTVNVNGSAVSNNQDPLLSSFGGSVHVSYNGYMPRSLTTDYRLPVRSWQEDVWTNRGSQTLGNNGQVLNTLNTGGTTSPTPR